MGVVDMSNNHPPPSHETKDFFPSPALSLSLVSFNFSFVRKILIRFFFSFSIKLVCAVAEKGSSIYIKKINFIYAV